VLPAAFIVVVTGAYFLGSIPTGYLVGKARGVDVRTLGSGNIGATNVFRVLGKPAGFFVLAIDATKGYIACTILVRWIALSFGLAESSWTGDLALAGGVAAVLGHNYTCWLKFKGGKGIATSAGVLLALVPLGLFIALGTWFIVFFVSKYVSLASIVAALVLPIGVWLTGGNGRLISLCATLSALAIYKHRSNIQRLLNGTENRVGARKPSIPSGPTS
jgi:acyl phosphate:glycerol-3-phosphate acyltransferase